MDPFVFMTDYDWEPAIASNKVTTQDFIVVDLFADAWTNFAKYG